jgi:hypothetical protein
MNGRTNQAVLPQTHQDEFPAEYSLAGCSPAEPASASSAALILILNQKPPVRQRNCSERQLSPSVRVSFPHAGHPLSARPFRLPFRLHDHETAAEAGAAGGPNSGDGDKRRGADIALTSGDERAALLAPQNLR